MRTVRWNTVPYSNISMFCVRFLFVQQLLKVIKDRDYNTGYC